MRRRVRKLLFAVAGAVAGGALVSGGATWWLLKTDSGHNYVREQIVARLSRSMNGKVAIARVRGDLLSRPMLDSLVIRDADDSVLISVKHAVAEYRLMDVWRGNFQLRNVRLIEPFIHVRRLAKGGWNYQAAFRRGTPSQAPAARRGPIVIDALTIQGGTFRWTEPWQPNDWLAGAERDSVIEYNLGRADANVRRVDTGFVRMREWRSMQAVLPRLRLRSPDSSGISMRIADLDADEFDPPFMISDARGTVRVSHDSVFLDIASFRLPASKGSARGLVVNKGGLFVDVHVVGDTVALDDIKWLYPTFPTTGGGRMRLDIRKARTSRITNYVLTRMDVRTTESRLRGAMTFGVGERILRLTGVDAELMPIDFRLFERFAGAPLALPWAGHLNGRVHARGGPLTNFYIDSTTIAFTDANVPGVVNRFRGTGEVDILRTINTSFHDFSMDVEYLDLRTLQAVNPDFAPLLGYVAGTARLDSLWYDVRFRDLSARYIVDTITSRFTGAGRMTLGEEFVVYDMDLVAGSLSMDAIAKSYPKMTLRGAYDGGFTVKGSLDNLHVVGDVRGAAGRIRGDIRVDALPPGFSGSGTLELLNADPARMFANAESYGGRLNLVIEAALRGDSLANLDGDVRATLSRSTLSDLRLDRGRLRARFADGLMYADTLSIDSDALTARGYGALGLHAGRRDSIRISVTADSLGGIRALISPADSAAADSLAGAVSATVRLNGNVDSLDAQLAVRGSDVVIGATTARHVSVDADIADLLKRRAGTATLTVDSATVGGVRLTGMTANARLLGGDTARITTAIRSATGPTVDAGADVTWDSLGIRARIDSMLLAVSENRWRIARPAQLVSSRGSISLDTLDLRGNAGGAITLAAVLPDSGTIEAGMRAESFPLGDLSALLQMTIPLSGRAALAVSAAGTRDAPAIGFRMLAQEAQLGETRIEGIDATGEYRDRALTVSAAVRRGGATVARANAVLPIDLTFRPVAERMLDRPLSGRIDADSTDLAVLETFTSKLTRATGRLDAHLTIGGTWKEPRLDGRLHVANGAFTLPELGVRYESVQVRLGLFGDSLHIDTLTARSGGEARIIGGLSVANWADPEFDLRLRTTGEFRAINRRGVATLGFNMGRDGFLRLAGKKSGSDLTGSLQVNGDVYIPPTLTKSVVVLDNEELARIIDTTIASNRRLLPAAPPQVVRNMSVQGVKITAGENLRLLSEEANVRLDGELEVVVPRFGEGRRDLALEGTLIATGGSYRLNLGPLQRTFNMQRGTVQFFGDPDIPAAVNLEAMYAVRQYDPRDARQDVQIRATISGSLTQLQVRLDSPDSKVSQSDAISYLLTGAPSLAIGGRASDYTATATRSLLASFGSAIGGNIGGGVVDQVTLSFAGLGQGYSGSAQSVTGNLLAGTRINTALRINDNMSARIDLGLCQIGKTLAGNSQGIDPVAFADAIGGKLDYRIRPGMTLSVGVEPATSALLCAQGATTRGFVPTPRQFGFDVLRLWRH